MWNMAVDCGAIGWRRRKTPTINAILQTELKKYLLKWKEISKQFFQFYFFKVNPILELLKFAVRQSDYDLAVMFNLVNGLLPSVNETWARALTKQLRDEILVRFYVSTIATLVFFFFWNSIFSQPWALMVFCCTHQRHFRRVITLRRFCVRGISTISAFGMHWNCR